MIRVTRAKKPLDFDLKVRQPGLRAIAELAGKIPAFPRSAGSPYKKIASRKCDIPTDKFPSYWTEALDNLMRAYGEICAYSCFRIHPVTGARSADHFAPKSLQWAKVYEWTNYRLCCSSMNSRKREFGDVLDPFEVKAGWFELELLGFQVMPGALVPVSMLAVVESTIRRLGLNDFKDQRAEDAERYWERGYSLQVLKEESPFVAHELNRLNRLNPGDIW